MNNYDIDGGCFFTKIIQNRLHNDSNCNLSRYRSSAGLITIILCVSSLVIDELLKISHVINLTFEMNKNR
ncbi:Hypothetical protein J6896_01246 [Nakaseomyces glabratus]|nr:hypothetical protein J7298_01246 [Nakaseomyces glabratus]KAH7603960.1 hypothetical protein J7295_01252 [Nakaseomyces glabratus]KAH7604945.1 hypothetical protein J7294_01238 [Nakaseomyces glabratus]KAH7607261.1 hypothetical protein J7293_01237 [Nakaseomyces glabratus]KAH7613953.1 hypothetical protein J7292_01227 [Nakaseomyces glabratus]